MAIVESVRLIERRLAMLRAERDQLAHGASANAALPPWAVEALVHAGLTSDEIRTFNAAATPAEDSLSAERVRLDDIIQTLEDQLVHRGDESLETLQGLAELALTRLQRILPVDPNDAFYDALNPSVLALLERVVHGLSRINAEPIRQVS